MHIINQPLNGDIGSLLISNLNNNFNKFSFIVAYAKLSGVRHLIEPINHFKSSGGQVVGIVGIDQFNTSIEAIQNLFNICDELYIYHSENLNQTFHPKVYCFESDNSIWISSGSSNMTSGGLFTNYETNIYEEINFTDANFYSMYTDIQMLFQSYSNEQNPCCMRVDQNLINNLILDGYIYSEQQIASNNRSTNNRTHSFRSSIFGAESFRAPSYSLSTTNNTFEQNTTFDEPNTIFTIDEPAEIYPNNIESYDSVYGSYEHFIDLIDGFSKNYYYIPQGVHLGHIFYIIKYIGDGNLDYRLSLFNASTSSSSGNTVRQTNYKIGACMELLLLDDYRLPNNIIRHPFPLQLSHNGQVLYNILNNNVTDENFYSFSSTLNTTWRMTYNSPEFYINFIRSLNSETQQVLFSIFNNLTIFRLLVDYITNHPTSTIYISELYNDFWQYPPVTNYLNLIGISVPSNSSLEHRIPFLISLLRSFSIAEYDSANSDALIRL